jgi:arginine deiminase
MNARSNINIVSEIGKLKTVILHRPDEELHNIVPQNLEMVLFDDIPYLKGMQQEHDDFASVITSFGSNVIYIKNLLADILKDKKTKKDILHQIIEKDILGCDYIEQCILDYLFDLNALDTAKCLIKGLSITDVSKIKKQEVLSDYMPQMYMFYMPPLPNMYFMRDGAAAIENGLSIHTMKNPIRKRESRILRAIYTHHEFFNKNHAPLWYDNNIQSSTIEGGDILVPSAASVLVGLSQRTDASAAQILANNLFHKNSHIQNVYAVQLPRIRAFMHLDTVCTMVDYDKFTIYPSIDEHMNIVKMIRGKNNQIHFTKMDSLKATLQDALNIKHIDLIKSGGGDPIIAAREQWNDSTNTFVLSPGVVIAYDRNEISNEVLENHGIKVIRIKGSELVRGRGGPRCMTMPICREEII